MPYFADEAPGAATTTGEPSHSDWSLVGVANGLVAYVGSFTILAGGSLAAPLRRRDGDIGITRSGIRVLERLILLGIPLLSLLHVAFGSILAMQAFFRATFPETNGAVVGVGLVRSISPLLTGIFVAAMMAVRAKPDWDEVVAKTGPGDDPDAGAFVLAHCVAAALAGPLLALWGALVGTLIGCLISGRVLGVASGTYFGFLFEMLQMTDVVGLVFLSVSYSVASTLIGCHEAVRPRARGIDHRRYSGGYRAMLVSLFAVLLINSLWFSAIYLNSNPVPTIARGAAE